MSAVTKLVPPKIEVFFPANKAEVSAIAADDALRAALRTALAKRDEAKERVQSAAEAEARAKELLDNSEAHLATFADVDEAITAHRATGIKRWASSGGARPSMELPPKLIERRRLRDEGQDQVAAARAAHEQLAAETAASKKALQAAEAHAIDAATAILRSDGARLAEKLAELRRQEAALDLVVVSLGTFWPPTVPGQSPRAFSLSPGTVAVIQNDIFAPWRVRPANLASAAQARWAAYHSKLVSGDPEATLESTR